MKEGFEDKFMEAQTGLISLDTNYNYENVTQVCDEDGTVIVEEWIEECRK